MSSINLLPKDMTAGKDVSRASELLKKISLALFGIFLIVVLAGGAFYFLSVSNLNRLKGEYEAAGTQVQSLQGTEASLIFLKDRLQKTQTVISTRTNEGYFAKQQEIIANAPEGVEFRENKIDSSASTIEVATQSSANLVTLMSTLLASSNLNTLVLNELSFGPTTGYLILFDVF